MSRKLTRMLDGTHDPRIARDGNAAKRAVRLDCREDCLLHIESLLKLDFIHRSVRLVELIVMHGAASRLRCGWLRRLENSRPSWQSTRAR